jgi:glycosyltransferase involved in cell wall biosynthesis
VTHYYPPELGAAQRRLHQLAVYLHEQGHEVQVLTGFPNYPTGIVPEGYRGKRFMREILDGVPILRTAVYATENSGFSRRLLNHTSFAISATLASFLAGPADVVVIESPPLFVAAVGPIIALLKRARLVLSIADQWPALPVAMGMLTNPTAIRLAQWLEDALIKRADVVAAVTPAIAASIIEQGTAPATKVQTFTNNVDSTKYGPGIEPADLSEWVEDDDFVVMYTGTISVSHALDNVLNAAELVADIPRLKFVLVGNGPDRDALMHDAKKRGVTNVVFPPGQPADKVPGLLARADVVLNSGMNHKLVEHDFPAKTVEYLAAGKPIISCGQSRWLMEESEAGLLIPPEHPEELAQAARHLYQNREDRERYGANARAYALRMFDRKRVLGGYESMLVKLSER